MHELRVHPSDRFLSAGDAPLADRSPRARLRALLLGLAALALAAALAIYPPAETEAAPLTIRARPHVTLSLQEAAALGDYAHAPRLTSEPGLTIGRAFGADDEDCVRAGVEIVCRR